MFSDWQCIDRLIYRAKYRPIYRTKNRLILSDKVTIKQLEPFVEKKHIRSLDKTLGDLETLRVEYNANIGRTTKTKLVEFAVQYFLTVSESERRSFIAEVDK